MIGTLEIWIAKCDYAGCDEFIRMDSKHDVEFSMEITGWKAHGLKTYCYKHVTSSSTYKLENTDQELVFVHSILLCEGKPCPIHNKTDHIMRKFPQYWRSDRQFMERICPHGIGHPDPDQREFFIEKMGLKGMRAEFVHGCDGCCRGAS